eukprot:Skav227750  [mRNA]  locus=scaffold3513:523629:524477:- [translate_table: standard]
MQYFPCDLLDQWADMIDMQTVGMYVFEHPKALTKLGQQAHKRYKQYLKLWTDFRQFQVDLEQDATDTGVQWSQDVPPPASPGNFACHLCTATFRDYKSLCAHVFKQHGLANVAHRYATGNHCRACLKVYHDRERLVHHLKYYRTGCLLKLSVSVLPLTDEELEEIATEVQVTTRTAKRRQRASGHVWPVTQAAGPLRPWPWQLQLSRLRPDRRYFDPDVLLEHPTWVSDVLTALPTEDSETILSILDRVPYHGTLESQVLQAFTHFADLFDSHETVEQHLAP